MTTTITPLGTYRNDRPYPFCPGCGHGSILDALDVALTRRGADPARVVVVSDIGCSGLSDQYFRTSAFHGLHGRSLTYATGIKLARPDLDVIVIMGDGGTGIGGAHLLSAARRNIGLTVIVFNNFNFGMTGGQHSTTTPAGSVTATTPAGNLERPLDLAATVDVNGAQYVWRGSSFDAGLPDRIGEAMEAGGFALLDVWELCTAYFVRSNAFSRRAIEDMLGSLDYATGVVTRRSNPEYSAEYRRRAASSPPSPSEPDPIRPRHRSSLDRRVGVVVAGAAGGRVRTAARVAGRAAIDAGLWAAQQDDYPITVKTGHSISTLVIGDRPIRYTGTRRPDLVVVTAPEGLAKIGHLLSAMGPGGLVLTLPDLPVTATPARVEAVEPHRDGRRLPKADQALALLSAGLVRLDVLPAEALLDAAGQGDPRFAERTLEVVRAGVSLTD